MKHYLFSLFAIAFMLSSCSTEEASEQERTAANFLETVGGTVSSQQWWRTTVTLKIQVITDSEVKLMLMSADTKSPKLYDYKEVASSRNIIMTAPQGQGNQLVLYSLYKGKQSAQVITLDGKLEESITLNFTASASRVTRAGTPPASLCGNSIGGDAQYYQFTEEQMGDFYSLMELSVTNTDAKLLDLNCNYELESNGVFYITWVNGYEGAQDSRILGYYVHSYDTWEDIEYHDLSETHKWDYIDGLAKVQYQISKNDTIDGNVFLANTWYDANFDLSDKYGATTCYNMDRVGDNAYNSQEVYLRYEGFVSAMRGISFKIDVPVGKRIGFYLRSDAVSTPEQWQLLTDYGINPYTKNKSQFKGTCFCAEFMNIEGNGRGLHRSFIKDMDEVIWMGMEDLVNGGDHDCNDLIFGVVADLPIWIPTIVDPHPDPRDNPGTDPDDPNNPDDPNDPNNPDDPNDPNNPDDPNNPNNPEIPAADNTTPFPWTIAYEDVNRDPDFDFNDAVIKLMPDYENELCCVTVMAAGSNTRMYLHFDGPNGDQNMGEIHELLGSKNSNTYINTKNSTTETPFTEIDCVPWPKGYTMANDAKRFYIEIQRGTCDDCTDVITLANEPGETPEALLVAGEWEWPKEGVHISDSYDDFHNWARNATMLRYWEWYQSPEFEKYVSY